MGVSFDCASSALLCAEDNRSILDLDDGDDYYGESEELGLDRRVICEQRSNLYGNPLVGSALQPQSEESLSLMIRRECELLPKADYAQKLDVSVRRDAIDWIVKVHAQYNFGPLTACLSINYLDRFLAGYELPKGKAWMTQLISVACLSLAIKMEETEVPLLLDLQAGKASYVFEAKTVQRMELLVLGTLNWRMQAVTPFSFLDYFLNKFSNGDFQMMMPLFSRSSELILNSVIQGIGVLEFRPSEIAAAVALVSLGEVQTIRVAKALTDCVYVDKDRVLRCYEVIQEMARAKVRPVKASSPSGSSVPQSPSGVLDAASLSYGSDDTTSTPVGSQPSSQNSSPASKKRKVK